MQGKNPIALAASVTAVAAAIAESCSNEEVALLSAVFSQLGDTLATMLFAAEIDT